MKFSIFEMDDTGLGNMSSGYGTVYNPFGDNYTGWTPPEYGGGGGGGGSGGRFMPSAPDPFDLDPAGGPVLGPVFHPVNTAPVRTNPVTNATSSTGNVNAPVAPDATPPEPEFDTRLLLIGAAIVGAVLILK